MDSGYMTSTYGANMMGYSNVDMLLEDVSRRMAQTNQQPRCRLSIPTGQRAMAPMRITKPSSTSNSPRGSTAINRRKTVMSDSSYRQRMAMIDQQMMASNGWGLSDSAQMPTKSHRPMSWHPSSQMAQQMYQPTQPSHAFAVQQEYQNFDVHTPAVYSGYTSPASSFSPMSMPFSENDHSFQYAPTSYPFSKTFTPDHTTMDDPMLAVQTPLMNNNQDPSMYSHFDWNHFAVNGFEDSTAPPTPDNFLPIQHPEPSFTAEEAIPYHPLSEDEPEGEELIGMGLYDTPDNSKSSLSDPHLDNYRIMSQLLGPTFRRPEPVGKGLKLEETWQPPVSKDEEEQDDEEDGEGDDDEEEESIPSSISKVGAMDTTNYVSGNTQNFAMFNAPNYGGAGWI